MNDLGIKKFVMSSYVWYAEIRWKIWNSPKYIQIIPNMSKKYYTHLGIFKHRNTSDFFILSSFFFAHISFRSSFNWAKSRLKPCFKRTRSKMINAISCQEIHGNPKKFRRSLKIGKYPESTTRADANLDGIMLMLATHAYLDIFGRLFRIPVNSAEICRKMKLLFHAISIEIIY